MSESVAVYVKDSSLFETLTKCSADSAFTFENAPPLSDYKENRFVVCDVENFNNLKNELREIGKQFLFVISPLTDEENMKLVEVNSLCHLIGQNEAVYATELLTSLVKVRNRKIWGLSPYMDETGDVRILSLSDSKNTNELINEALGNFNFEDYFSSPVEYLQVMANELISNSLYKGPNKRREEQGLSTPDRKSPVFLKNSDMVQVTLGMDQKGVGLSVQDSFGGLNYKLLISSLKRSFEEKTVMEKKDGAGLGLYLTFLHSNQFIINYRENFRTEVICIIEKTKRYKNYKQRIRSFHFFQEVPGEKANH